MATKDWEKNKSYKDDWDNTKNGSGSMIIKVKNNEPPSYNKYWVYEFYVEDKNGRFITRRQFKSKTQALAFARSYMRSH